MRWVPSKFEQIPKTSFFANLHLFRGSAAWAEYGYMANMAKATDGLAFGITRHCRIEGLPPMPPTPKTRESKVHVEYEEERLRNTRTAAGFVPKPCDTAARKTAETLPTERVKKLQFPASKPLAKRFRNTRTAAGFVPKPCDTAARKTAETLPTERTKKLESPAARFVPKPCETAGRKSAETLHSR